MGRTPDAADQTGRRTRRLTRALLTKPASSRNCDGMKARIHQQSKSSTQSGKAKVGKWLLDYEPAEQQRHDPLTGWAGSGDTRGQVKLTFDDLDSAVAYAVAHNLEYEVLPLAPNTLKLQAYADNFR